MATSITIAPARDSTRNKWIIAAGLAVALACLLTAPPLRAAEAHRGRQQHAQRNEPRQAYRHGNHRAGGGYYSGAYTGYYDGYYGPYNGGYWAGDGWFYYRDGSGGYRRDDGRHFRRSSFQGSKPIRADDRARDRDNDRDSHDRRDDDRDRRGRNNDNR